jgi:hypothetical protein
MSTFTRFTGSLDTTYDREASLALHKDYWRVKAFRYYIGSFDSDKWVDIPKGFLTDGASVPFLFTWLIPAWGEYGQATTLHDWLCENMYIIHRINGVETRVDIDRAEVDRILYEAMRVLEVKPWRRVTIQAGVDAYRIVRRPGRSAVSPLKVQFEAEAA